MISFEREINQSMGEALSAALPQIGVATWRIGAIHDRIVYVAVFVAQSPIGVAI